MSARRKRCPQGTCRDELMRGGKRVRCTACSDEFPCAHQCDHRDCQAVRDGGEPVEEHCPSLAAAGRKE